MQLVELFQFRLDERKIHIVDALKQYKTDPSIYITFSDLPKVGINPQSGYDTPLGIYTYPLNAVWDQLMFNNIPFAGDRPFVHVLKSTGNLLDLKNYNDDDEERDLAILYDLFINGKFAKKREVLIKDKILKKWLTNPDPDETPETIEQKVDDFIIKQKNQLWRMTTESGNNTALVKTPGGRIWNITRLLAGFFKDNFSDLAMDGRINRGSVSLKAPVIWNNLFRQLGYDGAVDRHGEGIIHRSEPTQAVFFSKNAIKHIATVENHYSRPVDMSNEQQIFDNFQEMIDWLIQFDYEQNDYDDEHQKKTKKKKSNHWLAYLKQQWDELMKTGESQNFKLGIPPEQFRQEMIKKPSVMVMVVMTAGQGILIPIVVSEILKHPEMLSKATWSKFLAYFVTKKPKMLKILLSKAIITIHAKIYDMTYEDAWKSLSDKVLFHLLHTDDMRDLMQYQAYPNVYWEPHTKKINKRFNKVEGDHAFNPAMIEAKRLVKPMLRYLDPKTCTDEALAKLLKEMEEENVSPF